jgi:predicted aspartyl protease
MKRIVQPDTSAMFLIKALLLLLLLSAFPPVARADFFQYTDQDGTVVMVDDESKIPAQHRKKVKSSKSDSAIVSKTTAVRFRNNHALVPVRLNYRNSTVEAWLLLDTGAAVTVISPGLAKRLGISQESTESRLAQLADGRVVETFSTRVDSLAVGPKIKYNAEVTIMPVNGPITGFDGLLGMNFLGEFRYHLDVNNQTIEWQ